MDLKEAKNIVNLSKEEIESVKRYLGFMHTNINIFADFSPETYQTLSNTSWNIDTNPEKIAQNIQDFINLYSAMYKESKKHNVDRRLVIGTSNKRISDIKGETTQFLSASTDESIAKTFAIYGDAALANIRVGEGVPFLYSSSSRDENSRDEKEYIIAPFCQAFVEKNGEWEGHTHYTITVRRPILEKKSPEELGTLYDEVISRFPQNIQDIKELDYLEARKECLNREYQAAVAAGTKKDLLYIIEDEKKVSQEYDRLSNSTYDFKNKLKSLLKGLCKQKELEIDQAHSIIAEDVKRKQEEEAEKKAQEEDRKAEERAKIEAEQKEEKRQKLISELTEKIAQNPQNTSTLEDSIAKTYDDFVHNEEKAKVLAKRFGIPEVGTVSNTNAKQLIEQITVNLQDISSKAEEASISGETDLEKAQQVSTKLTPLLDGVTYGAELVQSFPELVDLNGQQLETEIRKRVYDRVQTVMQAARYQKYMNEKVSVRDEEIGFLGRVFGKEQLKVAKLKNLDLKMQLAQIAVPQPKEGYHARELLADMCICRDTELGEEFTPEMQELYDAIKATFHDKRSGEFSETYIKQIASQRQSTNEVSSLPAVQNNKPRLFFGKFFGRNKAEAKMIELENQNLQQRILKARTTNATKNIRGEQEADAVTLFEQRLRGIAVNTQERDIQRLRGTLETTLDLWK